MKVTSPIGELPFEPRRITVSRAGIDIDGAMGAWPAHVHLDVSDLPALARLLPLRVLGLTVAGLMLGLAFRRRPHPESIRRRTPHA
jgi:hypothetical protein